MITKSRGLLPAWPSIFLVLIPVLLGAAPATRPAMRPATTQPGVTQFQPGIRINWKQRQVEVDVTVILRNAPIELFACSPKNREHEAIVRIETRPTLLFQALGLIGLTPGRPIRSDEQGRIAPASGDPVDIDIVYTLNGRPHREPIESWMKHADSNKPLGRLPWVFAGSIPLEAGTGLAADTEGTVIAVVDFPTALIALAEQHSDNNDELWLRPNAERIPLVGTTCHLTIRAAPLRVRLEAGGRLKLPGRSITRGELARRVRTGLAEQPEFRVELTVESGVDPLDEESLIALLRGLGLGEDSLTVFDGSGNKRPIIR